MKIDQESIKKIAHLARLKISNDEANQYVDDLTKILDLVDQMNQADTSQVEIMSNPHDSTQTLREDKVTETNQRETFLASAPQAHDGLFLVPQVIE